MVIAVAQIVARLRGAVLHALETETQSQIAERCGLSAAQINRLIHGHRGVKITLQTVLQICHGLDLDILYLLYPEDDRARLKKLISSVNRLISDDK